MKFGLRELMAHWRLSRLFSNRLQVFDFLRCWRRNIAAGDEIVFRIRQLKGKPLICRTGTTDAAVLYDTFAGLYHLPRHPLPEDASIVDLGTNVGYVAAHLAALYPGARIVGLELDPGNADVARRNLKQFGDRCSVMTAAIWTRDGSVEYDGEGEWGYKVIEEDSEFLGMGVHRRAPSICMESLMAQLDIERIDFLKMDIEGGEFALLNGAPDWLKKVTAVNVEIHDLDRVDEIAEPLQASGFTVQRDHIHWCQLIGVRL
ncbi:MAG: FkbM family methyltransferase [Alphaproteobacteria bacterium]